MLALRLMCGGVGDGSSPLPPVPKVHGSIIFAGQPNGIQVHWDRPMEMTCDIKSQITVLADGVPVPVQSVEFHPNEKSEMGILVGSDFLAGQAVTWAYASGACKLQEIAPPNAEADTLTHIVLSQVALSPHAWRLTDTDAWEDEHSIIWTDV